MKSLFEKLYPGIHEKSAYVIDYEEWYHEGKRGIIYDIDNTLVEHGAPATERAIALFRRLHAIGFDTCLISNNKVPRVEPFANAVGSKFVANAHKPSPHNYLVACEKMGVTPGQALFIGDQLFTDVWGASKAGITSILVNRIGPHEEIQIHLKRILEKIVLFFYRLEGREKNRREERKRENKKVKK